ncbi:MAG: hypothetical protein MZV63_55445 [Marinilabiliales bacterium]|nr:hypothetical protein [Marinilabiliales bacterium]
MKELFKLTVKTAMVIAAILLTGMIILSCKKDVTDSSLSRPSLKDACAESYYTLWAGQNINAGNLIVWNDLTTLYIEYQITDPNQALNEIHLWAGTDITLCPQNKNGNPKIGQFPYYADPSTSKPEGNPYLTDPFNYAISIPLADLGADCEDIIYIAAHGAATTETMWGEGTRFVPAPGDWATYSTYTICCGSVK